MFLCASSSQELGHCFGADRATCKEYLTSQWVLTNARHRHHQPLIKCLCKTLVSRFCVVQLVGHQHTRRRKLTPLRHRRSIATRSSSSRHSLMSNLTSNRIVHTQEQPYTTHRRLGSLTEKPQRQITTTNIAPRRRRRRMLMSAKFYQLPHPVFFFLALVHRHGFFCAMRLCFNYLYLNTHAQKPTHGR